MSALVLRWRQPPPIVTRWRGLDEATEAVMENAPGPIAALIGVLPGRDGGRGPQGLPGPGAEDPGDLTLLFDNKLI